MDGLVVTIAKTAIITLVTSRVTKAIGESEISEIITGTGLTICGVDIIVALKPLFKGIQEFNDKFGNAVDGLGKILDKLAFWN